MPGKKLVVIGGGAAGFFCAINAARLDRHLEVVLLEKSNKLLSKVRISGGGRCNVTHACFDIGEMSRKYPRGQHFVRKAFHQFFTSDTIRWFEERGVLLKAEPDGRMFPVTDSSETIINCLMKEAERWGVKIMMKTEVTGMRWEKDKFFIEVSSANCKGLTSDFVCVAGGGYPKSSMFSWLKETGHTIEEPVPSLFTFNLPGHPITQLMGVSVEDAKMKIIGTRLEERGPLLITHWGLSGPVVLRLSAWGAKELATLNWHFQIMVNWLPSWGEQLLAKEIQLWRGEKASSKPWSKNHFGIPQRLWEFLLEESGVQKDIRWADLPSKDQNRLVANLSAYVFQVKGKTTFKEEFVTAGGVKLSEVDVNTMMSKRIPGLFFAGEILDVDGITGGFNFQHAWTSGFVAAKAITGLYVSGNADRTA